MLWQRAREEYGIVTKKMENHMKSITSKVSDLKKDISKHFLNSSDNEVFSEEERTRQSSYDESSGLSE